MLGDARGAGTVRDQTDVRRLATRRDPIIECLEGILRAPLRQAINASIQPIVSYVLNPDTNYTERRHRDKIVDITMFT
jgi:hypothetical protein